MDDGRAHRPKCRAILASDEFARQCPAEFVPVGEFDLKGSARAVFGVAEEAEQSVLKSSP